MCLGSQMEIWTTGPDHRKEDSREVQRTLGKPLPERSPCTETKDDVLDFLMGLINIKHPT